MTSSPSISVVTPVLNGMSVLPKCVEALMSSDLPRDQWELIVADDGSTDGTHEWAVQRADRVVPISEGPLGPGFARNLAAQEARGAVLVFVDADVCVAPDALTRFRNLFADHADVGAAFGAYDDEPAAPGFVSQYRNLYHRYVHLQGAGDTETFWAGCGAVRTKLFLELGGFDTVAYPRPQIEDIELGYRVRAAGYRIVLDPMIQGTHLKRWTLVGMIRTDLLDRGIPWMRLLLGRGPGGKPASTLNVAGTEKLKTGLMGVACAGLVVGLVFGNPGLLAAGAASLIMIVLMNRPVYSWFAQRRGWIFAARVVPMNLLYYLISGVAVAAALTSHLLLGRPDPTGRQGPGDA